MLQSGRYTAPEPGAKKSTLSKKLKRRGTYLCPVLKGITNHRVTRECYLSIGTAGRLNIFPDKNDRQYN
jgi:hypothetical protein